MLLQHLHCHLTPRQILTTDRLHPERPLHIFDVGLTTFSIVAGIDSLWLPLWLGNHFLNYLPAIRRIDLADGPVDTALALSQVEALRSFYSQQFQCKFFVYLITMSISFIAAICVPYLVSYFVYIGRPGTRTTAFEIALVPLLAIAAWELYLYVPNAIEQISAFIAIPCHEMCDAVGGWLIPKLCNIATNETPYLGLGVTLSIAPIICIFTSYYMLITGDYDRFLQRISIESDY